MTQLAWNRYGKSSVRLVRVRRPRDDDGPAPHEIVDLTIDVQLEGDFDPVYVEGENERCLATDTMKNTVYAFALSDPLEHVEAFALGLTAHFVAKPHVTRAAVSAVQHRWNRITVDGRPHPHAFVRPGGERWTARATRDASGARVTSGLADLVVMKTADSSFAGFPRDGFTTLPDTSDRVLATSVTATWRYESAGERYDYSSAREAIRRGLVETFAVHDSRSVQHTLYAMGEAALARCSEAAEITLTMPNLHHLLVDLRPFGLENPNEVFVATDQPFGLIEATVRR
jgi:urate oxidase